VTLQKYFSHPSLVIYCFASPPIELKLGLHIGGRLLLIANPPGPIIMIRQSEIGSSSQIIDLLHSSLAGAHCTAPAVPFTSLNKQCQNAGPKPF